jgi:membrane fusion protein
MNAESGKPLFRLEALRHRADRLHGNVNIATPVAWQLIGYLLLTILVVGGGFLSLATYARVETVVGAIALDKGVASIVPSRPGTISSVSVADGQRVRAGDQLATIRAEESMVAGPSAPKRMRDALGQQDARLADQGRLLLEAASAEQARLRAQIDGDVEAIPRLEDQIADQRELMATADADYRNALEVAKGGFISKRDIADRQANVLSRHQQLAELEQSLSTKRAEIAQARRSILQAAMSAQAQVANAQSGRAALSQQLAQADLAQGYALTSPVDGIVTALTAKPGQPAAADRQLMLVVPTGSKPSVELYVPSAAAGFLARGQEVRLSVDAFPYQTFGTLKARVMDVSQAAVLRQTPAGTVPVYLVNASLPEPWVKAFGRRQPLLPGMTLSARIVTERRNLIEWLFEPLFAMRRR